MAREQPLGTNIIDVQAVPWVVSKAGMLGTLYWNMICILNWAQRHHQY